MTNLKRHVAKSVISLASSAFLQKILSVVIFYILLAKLSIHDYGIVALVLSLLGPAISILTLGLSELVISETAIARGAENLGKIKRIKLSYLKLGGISFLVLFITTFLFKSYLVSHYDFYFAQFYVYIVFLIAGQYLTNFIVELLKSFEEFVKISILETGECLFRLVFIVVALVFFDIGLLQITLASYVFSKWFVFVFGLFLSNKIITKLYKAKENTENELLLIVKETGKWVIVKDIFNQFISNAHPWLIKIFISTEAVALYDVAKRMYGFAFRLLPIQTVLFPLISRNVTKKEIISVLIKKARKYYFIFSLVIVVGVWLLIDQALLIVIPKYIKASFLIKLLIVKLFVETWSIGQNSILFAFREQRFSFFLAIYGAFQSLVISFVLLYFFSLNGLIIASILHPAIIRIISEYYIKKKLNILKFSIKDYTSYDYYDKIIIDAIMKRVKFFVSKLQFKNNL